MNGMGFFVFNLQSLTKVLDPCENLCFSAIFPPLPPFQCWLYYGFIPSMDVHRKTVLALQSTLKRGEGGQKCDFLVRGPTLL